MNLFKFSLKTFALSLLQTDYINNLLKNIDGVDEVAILQFLQI